jgi:hypothetical protein
MIIVNINVKTNNLFEIVPIDLAVQLLRNVVRLDNKDNLTEINTNSDLIIRELNLILLNEKHNCFEDYPKLKPENIKILEDGVEVPLDSDGCYEIKNMDEVIKEQNDRLDKFFNFMD